jgi:tetratricopeptide (TPR) repeat protein
MLLWEGVTLPARLLMQRGKPGDAALALAALPPPAAIKPYHDECLAYWGIDGLRLALEAQRLLDDGKSEESRAVVEAMTYHGEQMAKAQAAANNGGERSAWNRSFRALEMLASEVRGRLALAGPKAIRGSAYNWFRAAADRQRPAVMLYPPLVLTPMAARLGYYYMLEKDSAKALEAFNEALAAFPNNLEALLGLQRAYEAAKQTDKAAELAEKIKHLEEPTPSQSGEALPP